MTNKLNDFKMSLYSLPRDRRNTILCYLFYPKLEQYNGLVKNKGDLILLLTSSRWSTQGDATAWPILVNKPLWISKE